MKKLITLITLLLSVTVFSQNYIDASDTVIENVQEIETITDSTKVAVIDNNGIMKYVEKGDISEEVTQYFLSITEGSNTGYVHKYRADNPDNYGNIGHQAIDLSYSTAASSIMGALGGRSFLTGVNNRTSTSGYISVIIGGENNHVHGVKQNIFGGTDNTNVSSGAQNSVILGGNNNTISGSSGSNSVILGGYNNLNWASEAFLTGVGHIGRNSFETLFGRYSTDYTPTGKNSLRLFNIGFGDNASSRKDLFSILRSGKVGIGYNLFNPPNDSELLQVNGSVLIENTLKLNDYGEGNITGTATKMLAVDGDGNVIEEDLPSGGSSLIVTDSDEVEVENVNTINFIGATVTDNEDGSVDVEYSGGGSSITIGTDGQIPFTNSSGDDFDYSDNFKLTEYGVLKLENTWLGGGALSLEDGNKLGQITPDYIRIGDDSGSNPYFNITTTGDMFFRRNSIGTYPSLRLTNAGTGDASIGLMAGNRGVTMGIDNSDSDLFKIAIGNGAIPDLGIVNNIIRAEFGALTLDLKSTGIGYYLSDNWYTAITNNGFSTQSSNTAYSKVISNQGFITQSSAGNQISLSPEGNIKSTVGTSTDITLQLNNGARGEFSLPDLGNATTKDTIVTQSTQTVKQAKVTINSLDFRSISSNPIEIVSAQGAGTVINIISATAFLDYNSAAFNFTGEIYLRVGNNPSWSMNNTDINVVADNYISFKPPTQTSSSVSNSPVVITSGSNSLGGDSDVTIIITYTIDDYN